MIRTKKPDLKTADPDGSNSGITKEGQKFANALYAPAFITFPIRLIIPDRDRIKEACTARKNATGRSITAHDFIIEAIQEKLERDAAVHG